MHHLEQRYREVQSDLSVATERNKHSLAELSEKEETLVCLKVELSSLQEKYRVTFNEVCHGEMNLVSEVFQKCFKALVFKLFSCVLAL